MSRRYSPDHDETLPFTTQARDFLVLMGYMGICMGLILLVNIVVAVTVTGMFHWTERFLGITLR